MFSFPTLSIIVIVLLVSGAIAMVAVDALNKGK